MRSSGVLLHITSLPGKYGIGDLGPSAHEWVNMLAAANQTWWQMLPLGPCGEGNSPYRSYSAFAGNPLLISPDILFEKKLLAKSDLSGTQLPRGKVEYARVRQVKMPLLEAAYQQFARKPNERFKRFVNDNAVWLDDFALFMAVHSANPGLSWTKWPKALSQREPAALADARANHASQIEFQKFIQFEFFEQLQALRAHARRSGVRLIGDLPIYVSPESADVWAHPELFQLDRRGLPRAVAGVPPDSFSSTGQCWGNPLYNWEAMRADNFRWWKARLASALQQADLVRIDHFRGFESYWRIPAGSPTAERGRWIKAPGLELFEALQKNGENLPLLAEDLGIITPAVEALRDRFHLPGMRVLQFGFTDESANPHSPHNFIRHCFAYTGTHDNDTTEGWYDSLSQQRKRWLENYLPGAAWESSPAWTLIGVLMASTATHAIIPLQDLLELGNESRMNTPGKSDGNWEWRVEKLSVCRAQLQKLARLGLLYNRSSIGHRA